MESLAIGTGKKTATSTRLKTAFITHCISISILPRKITIIILHGKIPIKVGLDLYKTGTAMKRSLIIILFLLLNLANICAQSTFTARVVDAATGDPLPMASVYVSSSHSTITNKEGDFSIQAQPEDVLRITVTIRNMPTC